MGSRAPQDMKEKPQYHTEDSPEEGNSSLYMSGALQGMGCLLEILTCHGAEQRESYLRDRHLLTTVCLGKAVPILEQIQPLSFDAFSTQSCQQKNRLSYPQRLSLFLWENSNQSTSL